MIVSLRVLFSTDFALLLMFLLVAFSWVFSWPSSAWKNCYSVCSVLWLFRGPHFVQILLVLALEESSNF